ncbi:hypothetical protein COLU111180_20865 [Cohnella lubricantis]|uniref:Amidase n=1 Tax=Cohnella lubricantis TaxID=2163172 RepID=A0A841T2L1_9BACL|nr:hypothetical protein [Cohnella lubricantis]MBB6675813.1 hypothetical protein [Cohnella lubricantis]MBP2120654.1 hypothetical protein [Cohnella lubricantis]
MQANAKTQMTKATWLWDTPLIRASAADIVQFCKSNEINVIYLQINRDIQASDYASFIRLARGNGIEVHALDGRTTWGFTANRRSIDRSFDWLALYQSNVAADERFSGIHVDIEPYALPYWDKTGSDFVAQWQGNVRYIVQRAKDLRLPIAADIPFWLSGFMTPDGKETLSRWMMRHYGAVTILAYRDSAQGISNMAAAELTEAADLNIPATVGVETVHSLEGANITFFEEGRARMNEQLDEAASLLAEHGTFAGLAIHDYKAWRAMED